MTIVNELCKDEDGCDISVGMRDWASSAQPGNVASFGPYRFFVSESSNWWRISDSAQRDGFFHNQNLDPGSFFVTHHAGEDGNGVVRHILRSHDCYFTDGKYELDADGNPKATDDTVGFGLLNWFANYRDTNMVCTLDIDD